jgi:hypothetical protein
MRGHVMGLVVLATAMVSCSSGPAEEPAAVRAEQIGAPAASQLQPYIPVVTLNDMMVSVVDSNSHKIWDAEAKGTISDEEWKELEHSGVTLAAAGSLTMLSGNGPEDRKWLEQPDWNKWSQGVSVAGESVVRAVRAKDVAALRASGDQLVLTCINCHREYRLNVPKIWSDHEQVH